MRLTDLMIGDIVHINNKELGYEHDAIVLSIEPSFVGVKYIDSSEDDLDQFAVRMIEPIVLDRATLIHNGLEESYDKDYDNNRYYLNCSSFCSSHKILLLTSSKIDTYFFKTNNRYVHIKYIHELQHLLRLIGEHELADNFKLIR